MSLSSAWFIPEGYVTRNKLSEMNILYQTHYARKFTVCRSRPENHPQFHDREAWCRFILAGYPVRISAVLLAYTQSVEVNASSQILIHLLNFRGHLSITFGTSHINLCN